MNDVPRYTTLTDYLAVLRRQRLLILVIVVAFTAGAYFVSSRQTKTYVAEAALSLPEPGDDSAQIGVSVGARQPPDERAAISSRLVARPSVARRVRRELEDRRSENELLSHMTVRVEAKTNFLIVEASSSSPADAALLSNEFASQFERQQTLAERRRLGRVSTALRRRLRELKRSAGRIDELSAVGMTNQISRTEALREVARPVQTVRRAQVPAAAVSPKVTRDTLLGALLGLTVAILAAFARDGLDRRLRTANDVERQLKLSTLSRISRRALGKTGGPSNGRKSLTPRDIEAFRILRANLRSLGGEEPPRTVAVTSAMPGEGKTTVATSLAWVNAVGGKRTLLVECDLRRPAIAQRLNLPPAPGLVDYLRGTAGTKEVIQEVSPEGLGIGSSNGNSHGARSNLWCITAGSQAAASVEMLDSDPFRDFIAVVARSYDAVILDSGPMVPVVDPLQVIPLADAVVLCVRASHTTRDQLAAARATLTRMQAPPVGLVVTGVSRDELKSYGYGAAGEYAERPV